METIFEGKKITWRRTGEITEIIDVYDSHEVLEGYDEEGNLYVTSGDVSCGEIVDICEELIKRDYSF